MTRPVEATRPLRGDGAELLRRFRGDPGAWLPEMTHRGNAPGQWLLYLWGGEIGVLVDATLGEPEADGEFAWRLLRWNPGTWIVGRSVPTFDGRLGLRLSEDGAASLQLHGSYRPPAGLLGLLADRAVLHRLAAATAHQLLADLAARLEESEPAVQSAPPGPAAPPPAGG